MKILRITASAFLLFSVMFSVFYGNGKINEERMAEVPKEYRGVISVWQIDSFEGGTGSRRQFLLDVAKGFEKENEGVLIMVVNHTFESADKAIKGGNLPDLISYGAGFDLPELSELKCERGNACGSVGDSLRAIPWCRGGYVLFYNPKLTDGTEKIIDCLFVSESEYTLPLFAFTLDGYKAKEINRLTPMDAYIKFTAGKTPYFLGTQRDLTRLKNRGMEVGIIPLKSFSDLYQYISVVSSSSEKAIYSERFINYLLSDAVQEKLSKINMFSEYLTVKYDDADYSLLSKQAYKAGISVFTLPEKIKELQDLSESSSKGDDESKSKIKNVLIYS